MDLRASTMAPIPTLLWTVDYANFYADDLGSRRDGQDGRRVVSRLVAHDVPVRVGSRRAEPPFNWQDDTTWEPSLRGVDAAYIAFYPDAGFPGAAQAVGSFAELAAACGVHHLVLLADRGAAEATRCEQAIQDSATAASMMSLMSEK